MTFQGRRRWERDRVKEHLLERLRHAQQTGEFVKLPALAASLGRSVTTLVALWHELAEDDLIDYPCEDRSHHDGPGLCEAELAERVAIVREAKIKKWVEQCSDGLNTAELNEVLP